MRSHRLDPGERTFLDVSFNPAVDGPGRHGEVVRLITNDQQASRDSTGLRLRRAIVFYITINPR